MVIWRQKRCVGGKVCRTFLSGHRLVDEVDLPAPHRRRLFRVGVRFSKAAMPRMIFMRSVETGAQAFGRMAEAFAADVVFHVECREFFFLAHVAQQFVE